MHFPATCEGLAHWVTHAYEHLGWMSLAHAHKQSAKVTVYRSSLNHLKDTIEWKINAVHDEDIKADLHILHENVMLLIKTANKLFGK